MILPIILSFKDPLPTWSNLLPTTFFSASMGYIYGKVTDTPALLCTKIFIITHLANSLFYLLGNSFVEYAVPFLHRSEKGDRETYAYTTALTQVITIIAIRHFDLIGTKGTVGWTLVTLGMFIRQLDQSYHAG